MCVWKTSLWCPKPDKNIDIDSVKREGIMTLVCWVMLVSWLRSNQVVFVHACYAACWLRVLVKREWSNHQLQSQR